MMLADNLLSTIRIRKAARPSSMHVHDAAGESAACYPHPDCVRSIAKHLHCKEC
jgi:hypothetical protein